MRSVFATVNSVLGRSHVREHLSERKRDVFRVAQFMDGQLHTKKKKRRSYSLLSWCFYFDKKGVLFELLSLKNVQ